MAKESSRFFISIRQLSVLGAALAIVLLALFNNSPVPVSLLFTVVTVPLSVLVLGALLVGVLMGYVMAAQRNKRRQGKKESRTTKQAQAQMLPAAEEIVPDDIDVGGAEAEYAQPEDPLV